MLHVVVKLAIHLVKSRITCETVSGHNCWQLTRLVNGGGKTNLNLNDTTPKFEI